MVIDECEAMGDHGERRQKEFIGSWVGYMNPAVSGRGVMGCVSS